MESILLSIKYLEQQPRWDFRYFDPKYLEIEKILREGKYPLEPLDKFTRQIQNFGAYSLCNLLNWVEDEEAILYLKINNLKEDGIDWSDILRITPEVHEQLPKSKVYPGDILYSMAGTIGLAVLTPESLGECNSNQAIAKIRLKPDTLNSEYLVAFLNSRIGQYQSERIANGQTVLNINLGEIGKLLVPVPPKSIQDQIAQVMKDAYSDRRNKIEQAEKLLRSIDDYVFGILNISPSSVKEDKRFLKQISEIQGGRFDVEFNMGFHKFDPYLDRVSLVNTIATFPKETQDPTRTPEAMFNYIDIASVDIELGNIREVSKVLGVNAPSRARQIVRTGDIIISTVRPTRGAIALIPKSMDGFICSTGFSIVRPKDRINSEYLHIALLLHTTLEQFGRRSAGSSYPAILDSDIKNTLIPVPNQETQNEVSSEVVRRRTEAKILRSEAEAVVAAAKARVERMILGEEETNDNG
jgi:type I restriction enzyme, S subunit